MAYLVDDVFVSTCRWLYWTDFDSTVPRIQRVSLDGTSKTILHDTGLSLPYCLTLDYDAQVLYWADYSRNRIERSNADGSNRGLLTTSLLNDAYSITFFNGQLYWTDLSHNRIVTASNTSSTSSYLTAAFGDMYGIKAITEDRQPKGGENVLQRAGRHLSPIVNSSVGESQLTNIL